MVAKQGTLGSYRSFWRRVSRKQGICQPLELGALHLFCSPATGDHQREDGSQRVSVCCPHIEIFYCFIFQNQPAPNVGLEPTTLRLRVSCSSDWASRATDRRTVSVPGNQNPQVRMQITTYKSTMELLLCAWRRDLKSTPTSTWDSWPCRLPRGRARRLVEVPEPNSIGALRKSIACYSAASLPVSEEQKYR